jgi:hypothetical protein
MLPATLPLFATGLGALGLLGWFGKRKARVSSTGRSGMWSRAASTRCRRSRAGRLAAANVVFVDRDAWRRLCAEHGGEVRGPGTDQVEHRATGEERPIRS